MAIEKSYFSTYGWEVPDAYYKVNSWTLMDKENDVYDFGIGVYRNELQRTEDKPPLTTNTITVNIDRENFDESKSEEDNLKTQAYRHLKNLTKSFKNDSKDV